MKLNGFLHQVGEWLQGTGPNSEIVMSSRVRIARNFDGMPFTHRANREQLKEIVHLSRRAIQGSSFLKNSIFIDLEKVSHLDRQLLLERHLISREHAEAKGLRGVAIGDREIVSIMMNEEDHLRMQAIQSGFQLMEAWRLISQIDKDLDSKLKFAFSGSLGYLTACPTNVGTGMRASVMLHLPSLVLIKQIGKVLQAITKLGLAARGLYGEGTKPAGNFFQVSNQITLGQSEEEIIDNIEKVVKQILGYEDNARKILLSKRKKQLEDRVFRAYGILKNVRIISSQETLSLLSDLRLGVDLGLIDNIKRSSLNELFIRIQPAHLQKMEGKELSPEERDVRRARLIREKLK